MSRLMLAMVGCLVVGAGGMWVASNFKVKFEAVGAPDQPPPPPVAQAPAPPVPPTAEPAKLPAHLLAQPTPGVVPASGSVPAAAVAAAALGVGAGPTPEVEAVVRVTDTKGLVWEKPTSLIHLVTDRPFVVLEFKSASVFEVEINGDKREVPSVDGGGLSTLSLDVSNASAPGTSFVVKITRSVGLANAVTAVFKSQVTFVRPHVANEFFVDSVATTDGVTPTALTGTDPTDVFGTYLRVRGRAVGAFRGASFLLVANSKTTEVPVANAVAPVSPSGDWEYRLTLPAFNGNDRPVLVTRGTFDNGHEYAVTEVKLRVNLLPSTLSSPTIAVKQIDGNADETSAIDQQVASLPTYLLNRRKLKVTVAPASADTKAVSLYLDDRLVGTQATTDTSAKSFDIPDVGGGRDHVLRAVAGVADKQSPAAQVGLKVVTSRPRVESVTAPGFGSSNGVGVEKILVRFNSENPLALASVVAANAFEVKNLNEKDTDARIQGTPSLDTATNTVTLTVNKIVAGSYAVRVKTVTDVYGNVIESVPGTTAPFAFETTLFTNTVDAPQPSVAAGVSPTGQNAVFPEYTKFREFEDGANPGDRVESRVVRLYYTRDGHRVVQIVNRDVRSFNGPSVDIRRRAADKVRDEADTLQNDRQRQERAAVLSAVATRQAESQLKQLEAKLQTARTEQATATVQLSQRTQQLDQFTRTLGRDQTNIDLGTRSDLGVDTATRRLAAVNADIERTNAVINDSTPPPVAPTDELLKTARESVGSKQTALATADAAAKVELAKSTDPQQLAASEVLKAQTELDLASKTLNEKQGELDVAAVKKKAADEAVAADPTDTNKKKAQADAVAALTAALAARDAAKVAKDGKQTALDTATSALRTKNLTLQTTQFTEGAKVRNAQTELEAAQRTLADLEQRADTARQKAAQREAALRQANATLVTQKVARDQAQRDLDQAVAAARGRAIADTRADPSLDTTNGLREEIRKLQLAQSSAATTEQATRADAEALRGKIQGLRAEELRLTEAALGKEGEERRKREEQFRREVAAALADPDTYAAGKPESVDPVLQCSVSVIGEGLIHIRGPVKGLNVIRTMINQIDAPTGQVRVGVHTVQVNGERVERMNKVVENIQRYIDHSRFLTATSAQMLRNAVTTVASRKAVEAGQTLAPGCTQADRDQKYLYCFFGKDFIDELKSLDSEFLRTGNKVLSLHSMDSTSLASALFLMSLARNDVREEILREFQGQLCTKLPQAEWQKFVSGLSCPSKLEACFDRQFCTLAQNAKFPSFLGFFNSEVLGADTLTPVQREFIRLAQIFKARMVTELELKQRVMERTLLEDRVGNFRKEQRDAKDKEDAARNDRLTYQKTLQTAIASATGSLDALGAAIDDIEGQVGKFEGLLTLLDIGKKGTTTGKEVPGFDEAKGRVFFPEDQYRWIVSAFEEGGKFLDQFYYIGEDNYKVYEATKVLLKTLTTNQNASKQELATLKANARKLFALIRAEAEAARDVIGGIVRELRKDKPNVEAVLNKYDGFRREIEARIRGNRGGNRLRATVTTSAFAALQQAFTAAQASARVAQLTRRPLDEKKLLDMLVDDMEEKLIELLDGTRAHTANVDNYLKALATALDDDFTTQFYQPAFKKIRTLAAGWDVQLGQIETTTVLTNNRVLGKVSPTASMEFDLPRRDILIKEAFKGAKAAVQDYGALLNDPVFLSMVKMYSGSPVGATYGGFGGLPAVKNALPGLPGSSDELIMAQSGAKRPEFGTYLEGLIADPAIYKFETGTGYEIRPVLSPDGQAVVFGFDYMYTTDVREPVRADEKHLGRVKRHLLHTDVQLSNFELREVSKYWVSIKAARTSKGVSLLQDIPVAGALFRPAPSASSSLQQNLIYAQAAIFPTLFDLMGLRYAPAVADLSPDGVIDDEWVARGRREYLRQYIFDYGASRVDDALRILYGERRPDLYRSQRSIPAKHPNGYEGPGLRQRDAHLEEEYDPRAAYPPTKFAPGLRLPQRFDRDPFDPSEPPAGGPAIPPGPFVPGHPGSGLPGGMSSSRELPRTPLGTTVTRVPPRSPAALPPIPMNGSLPKIPQPVPVIAPPPPTPTQPSGVISRSQAPLDPPAIPRRYASDPVPLPRGSFFPR